MNNKIWIAVLAVMLTFLMLDAGALAWSASLVSGRQAVVEILAYFIVLSGTLVTVWKMNA